MKFAVTIATYQRKDGKTPQLLKRALDSVFNQTHQDFRVFIVGDNYEDDLLLHAAIFAYRDTDAVRSMFKEWWLHTSIYHLCDQLSFPYVLKKSGVRFNVKLNSSESRNLFSLLVQAQVRELSRKDAPYYGAKDFYATGYFCAPYIPLDL